MKYSKTRMAALIGIGLLVLVGAFLMVSKGPSVASAQTASATPTKAPLPTPTKSPLPTPVVPFEDQWMKSAHNDINSAPFTHWNESKDKTVEVACAQCHSGVGFQDFTGADGSAAGKVDKAPAIGSTVDCATCHNDATMKLTSVTFPSGQVVDHLGREAVCMSCHQGGSRQVCG